VRDLHLIHITALEPVRQQWWRPSESEGACDLTLFDLRL